jgi:polysaccharide biosynthesis transport protein
LNYFKKSKTFYARNILASFWRRKWLVVIPVVLVTAITTVGTFYLSPLYEASVTISMEKPVRLSQDIQRLIGGSGSAIDGNSERMDRELQSLKNEIVSSPYISRLVQNLQFDNDPLIESLARKLQVSHPSVSLDDLKFDMLLRGLRKRIRVEFAGINQVKILAQSSSPEEAKLIVQNLGDIFIQEKTKEESHTNSITSDFSSSQLSTYESDLQNKITQRTDIQTELLQIQLGEAVASQENRKQINIEVQAITQEIDEKEKDVRDTQIRLSGLPGGLPVLEESPALQENKSEITKLLASMPDMMQKSGWNTPNFMPLKMRLFGFAKDVDEEVGRIVRSRFTQLSETSKSDLITFFCLRLRLETLYSYRNNMKLTLSDLDRRANLMPDLQAKIEQLTREIDATRNLRDQFKLSQEGTQISEALLMESRFRVVEPPRLPLAPIWPNKKMIVLLGFLVGMGLGAGALIIAEFLDDSIKSIEDAEQALGFPVVGTIPKIEGLESRK